MSLAGIHVGDVVRAGGSHAVVIGVEKGQLAICWIGSKSTRRVKASEVEAWWSKRKRT